MLMHRLNTLVLQRGDRYSRDINTYGAQKQQQRDTVQAAGCHIAASIDLRMIEKFPRPDFRIVDFEFITFRLFRPKHPHFVV